GPHLLAFNRPGRLRHRSLGSATAAPASAGGTALIEPYDIRPGAAWATIGVQIGTVQWKQRQRVRATRDLRLSRRRHWTSWASPWRPTYGRRSARSGISMFPARERCL